MCLCIHDYEIKPVSTIKFLGVILDEKLQWSDHINYVKNKIPKSLDIIYKAKKHFSPKSLIKPYNAFILPYYIYCVEVWGSALSTVIDPLIKLQKKIIRVIINSHYLAHTHDLFLVNNILPFNTLVQYRIGLIMFK